MLKSGLTLSLLLPIFCLAQPDSQLFEQGRSHPEEALLPDFSRAGYNYGNTGLPELSRIEMPVFEVDRLSRSNNPIDLRLVARDSQGNWAMSDQILSWDAASGTYADIEWTALDPNFELKTGDLNSASIDRVGFLMLSVDWAWIHRDDMLRFNSFRVSHR